MKIPRQRRGQVSTRSVVFGLLAALMALVPATAQAAEIVVPHPATHVVTPQVVPQPAAPPSPAPAPGPPPAPSTSTLEASTGGKGFAPSEASYPPRADAADLDVGHRAGERALAAASEAENVKILTESEALRDMDADMQQLIDGILTGLGISWRPQLELNIASQSWYLAFANQMMNVTYEAAQMLQPEVAVRDVLGYSGGVSDQACGADFSRVNAEIEDPNSGIALC